MAKDELVGNIPTEKVCELLREKNIDLDIDYKALRDIVNNMSIYFQILVSFLSFVIYICYLESEYFYN